MPKDGGNGVIICLDFGVGHCLGIVGTLERASLIVGWSQLAVKGRGFFWVLFGLSGPGCLRPKCPWVPGLSCLGALYLILSGWAFGVVCVSVIGLFFRFLAVVCAGLDIGWDFPICYSIGRDCFGNWSVVLCCNNWRRFIYC